MTTAQQVHGVPFCSNPDDLTALFYQKADLFCKSCLYPFRQEASA